MEVSIEELTKAVDYLRGINRKPLEEIVFTENGIPVKIDPTLVNEWSFIGLNNVEFITSKFYKDGYTEIEED